MTTSIPAAPGTPELAWLTTTTRPQQLLACLYVLAALNQAAATRSRVATLPATQRVQELDHAEQRLQRISWNNPAGIVAEHATALAWSEVSTLADQQTRAIADHYSRRWGIHYTADTATITVDPAFDPDTVPQWGARGAAALRAAALREAIDELLPGQAAEEVMALLEDWRHADRPTRWTELNNRLTAAGIPGRLHAHIAFAVGFLEEDLADLDLLTTPVLVDPGEDLRGRLRPVLDGLLSGRTPIYEGTLAPLEGLIAPMYRADREQVRASVDMARAGHHVELPPAWRLFVDRDEVETSLETHIRNAARLLTYLDELAHRPPESAAAITRIGVDDRFADTIVVLHAQRAWLLDVTDNAQGLHPLERARLRANLTHLDTGATRDPHALPELMWADENTKATIDDNRDLTAVNAWTGRLRTSLTETLRPVTSADNERAVTATIRVTTRTLSQAALGGRDPGEMSARVRKSLAEAGIGGPILDTVTSMVDVSVQEALTHDRESLARARQWETRLEVFVAARDDPATTLTDSTTSAAARTAATRPTVTAADPLDAAMTAHPQPAGATTAPPRHDPHPDPANTVHDLGADSGVAP